VERFLSSTKGVAALEFAVVLPLLLLLAFGLTEFGLLMYNQQVLTNASREGARAGIVQSTPSISAATIATVVQNYAAGHLVTFGSRQSPTVEVGATCAAFGQDLAVMVQYDYTFLVAPKFMARALNPLTLTARTVMRCE
jgi:Flp pilus assembly protein TadG